MKHFEQNGKKVEFSAVTGEVIGTHKHAETHVSSNGGRGYISQGSGFVSEPKITSKVVVKLLKTLLHKEKLEMRSRKAGHIGTLGAALLVVTLAGCGGVEGNYACKDSVLASVQLKSGGKAYVTMAIFGQKIEKGGTYTVDGDKVNIVIDGDSMLFTASGKTLNGGEMFGKCTAS